LQLLRSVVSCRQLLLVLLLDLLMLLRCVLLLNHCISNMSGSGSRYAGSLLVHVRDCPAVSQVYRLLLLRQLLRRLLLLTHGLQCLRHRLEHVDLTADVQMLLLLG
jgi:hypothetical protein